MSTLTVVTFESKRRGPVAILFAAAGIATLLLGACGGDEGSSATSITIQPTSYVTRPPVTTTPPAGGASVPAGAVAGQVYEVQAGDGWLTIAQMYQVGLDELTNYNDKTRNDPLYTGDTIKIPPNGIPPTTNPNATDTTDDNTITADGTAATTTTPPDPRDDAQTASSTAEVCTRGSYTVSAGDTTRTAVAEKFDITVEEMDAANQNTPGYGMFYPGLKIVIPCGKTE